MCCVYELKNSRYLSFKGNTEITLGMDIVTSRNSSREINRYNYINSEI